VQAINFYAVPFNKLPDNNTRFTADIATAGFVGWHNVSLRVGERSMHSRQKMHSYIGSREKTRHDLCTRAAQAQL